jgi:hypothetical protein
MNDIILEVCNLEKSLFVNTESHMSSVMLIGSRGFGGGDEREGEKKKGFVANRKNSILPDELGEQMTANMAKHKQEINLHSGFVNLKQSIKVID